MAEPAIEIDIETTKKGIRIHFRLVADPEIPSAIPMQFTVFLVGDQLDRFFDLFDQKFCEWQALQ